MMTKDKTNYTMAQMAKMLDWSYTSGYYYLDLIKSKFSKDTLFMHRLASVIALIGE